MNEELEKLLKVQNELDARKLDVSEIRQKDTIRIKNAQV